MSTHIYGLKPILGGYRVAENDEFVIDMNRMAFNWRLTITAPEDDGRSYAHGYCYFGISAETFARALAAAYDWAKSPDPFNTPPPGYDKMAF